MLQTLLSQPLTQLLGIVLIGALAQKAGIPVKDLAKWVFTFGDKQKGQEEIPAWAAQLLQHFNHDTTAHHERTHELLEKMIDKIDLHNKMEEGNRSKLDEILKYGVPCSKDK